MAEIGKIRRRVTFVDLTPAQEAGNGGTWNNPAGISHGPFWAERKKDNSNRAYGQMSQGYQNIYKYEIWYNSAFTPGANMILRDSSQDYTITSIELINDKKRKYLITAELKASG